MKINFISFQFLVMIFFCLPSVSGQVQNDQLAKPTKTLGDVSSAMQALDQLGNVKPMKYIQVSPAHKSMILLNGCNNTGKFHLYFEEGSGFEDENNDLHLARRNGLGDDLIDIGEADRLGGVGRLGGRLDRVERGRTGIKLAE